MFLNFLPGSGVFWCTMDHYFTARMPGYASVLRIPSGNMSVYHVITPLMLTGLLHACEMEWTKHHIGVQCSFAYELIAGTPPC